MEIQCQYLKMGMEYSCSYKQVLAKSDLLLKKQKEMNETARIVIIKDLVIILCGCSLQRTGYLKSIQDYE